MSDGTAVWKKLLILPPVAIGAAVLAWQITQRQEPARSAEVEPVTHVRVVEALKRDVTPLAEGHGPVQPARIWTAVAQVSGRIVEMHANLGNGSIVTAGTLLLWIDPVDYQLALARIDAELAESDVRADNARALLDIGRRSLAVAGREFERIRQLVERGTAPQSDADAAERNLLNARGEVRNLENTLALLPAQRDVLEARRAQALRDIENTRITAPFDMRVAALSVETGQYVSAGQSLLQGDSIGRVEVVAQVSMASLRTLVLDRADVQLSPELLAGRLADVAGFRPTVELDLGNIVARWDAEFVRISDAIDAETRTIGVVVAVDDPIALAIPGRRPPLSKGMFVKVAIRGDPLRDRVLVPRHAVRAGSVLLADDDNRLSRRAVEVTFEQQGISVIESGLDGGERVLVTDVVPRVEGMRLEPVIDEDETMRLRDAAGEAP